MTQASVDQLGPVDYVVVEFPQPMETDMPLSPARVGRVGDRAPGGEDRRDAGTPSPSFLGTSP